MNKDIDIKDLIAMAGDNVYDTEYSHKLNISCKQTTYDMFNDLKVKLKALGVKVNNAQLFELMCVELYNSNLKQYSI
jgi:hypothetical protein